MSAIRVGVAKGACLLCDGGCSPFQRLHADQTSNHRADVAGLGSSSWEGFVGVNNLLLWAC